MCCDVAGAPVWSSTGFSDRGFLTPYLNCQYLVIHSALHTLSIILCFFSLFLSLGLPFQLLSPRFLEFHPKTLKGLRPTMSISHSLRKMDSSTNSHHPSHHLCVHTFRGWMCLPPDRRLRKQSFQHVTNVFIYFCLPAAYFRMLSGSHLLEPCYNHTRSQYIHARFWIGIFAFFCDSVFLPVCCLPSCSCCSRTHSRLDLICRGRSTEVWGFHLVEFRLVSYCMRCHEHL